jgi:hypothetical protein
MSGVLPPAPPVGESLLDKWRAAWPQALACWSRYTRLHDARLCKTSVEAAAEGLAGSFAMIRIADQSVVIDMQAVARLGLQDYAVEVLAHEIGHHVLAPGSALDHFRMLARMRRALPTLEATAPMVANLYTDLFINDRLQRQAGLRIAGIYRILAAPKPGKEKRAPGAVWQLYMRIYEHLWQQEKGSLGGWIEGSGIDGLESDAWLGARLVRVYANDIMAGAGRFATLVLPYLVQDEGRFEDLDALHDTKTAAAGAHPAGLQEIEDDELTGAIHPACDPRITGADEAPAETGEAAAPTALAGGQTREPYEYGEILKSAGIALDDHQLAMRYYRERALPHLIPFPTRRAAQAGEPQLEALEPWEIGDPLDEIDWLQSVTISPRPIPGLTTVRRAWSVDPGAELERQPVDLDMYVDSSGSMPNPQVATSWLALAGAIIALSALRAGSSVQVTLWSGKHQVQATRGFVRDSDSVLRVLTGFFGGGTSFPIGRLRDTYDAGVRRPTHILHISDDGITTMFEKDERGNSGWDVAARALAAGGAGGTMALNLAPDWASGGGWLAAGIATDLQRARSQQGWDIHAIADMQDLVAFARAFSRRHYTPDDAQRSGR